MSLPPEVLRLGAGPRRAAALVPLRAGPLSMTLDHGGLRYVRLGSREVLRGIYAAVRDPNWNTVEPTFLEHRVDAGADRFQVRFTARHRDGAVDFEWDGAITGTPEGVVSFTMAGVARSRFLKNRIGFCVLHPMELAGTPAEVTTVAGRVAGRFPVRISPRQPFLDMLGIRHAVAPGWYAQVTLTGDVFEMEDQRNWTDGSFKIYCPPLRHPFPSEMRAGDRILQSVTLTMEQDPAHPIPVVSGGGPDVAVDATAAGMLPPLGLGVATDGPALTPSQLERLRALRLAHLRVELDLRHAGWAARLDRAAAEAAALGVAMEIDVVTGPDGQRLDALAAVLAARRPAVQRLFVFDGATSVTSPTLLDRARALAAGMGAGMAIGGGSRANFAEFNRLAFPLGPLDVAGYPINPQVHAFDEASLVETLAAQPVTVENARALVGEVPLAIGPITLRPRFNAVATGPVGAATPGALPARVDPRQPSLLAAAWTVGSLRRLAEARVAALTYFETVGWGGVLDGGAGWPRHPQMPAAPGALYPLYHVFADVGELAGAALLAVSVADPFAVEALALRHGTRMRLLVANLTEAPRRVRVTLPAISDIRVRHLDETTAEEAMERPDAFRLREGRRGAGTDRRLELDLLPFAITRVDGRCAAP